ncbi:SDR family oxidoreductase [Gloeobacter morelensis MG652769]|uniref:SDR family oxidoreductase n=2 Tax=Gloeobacter TaxID=33071 RepID=A0ABY3PTQ0_9CYAN|nr:SDR family oxidoreductase [Gloeobacter morelensis MG652769]
MGEQSNGLEIAIIGMAGRFPGAADIEAFWGNLCAGAESIRTLEAQELEAAGVDPALLANPDYVRARGVLEGADLFDAGFFDFSPREAEITDPQQRLFLECAWEALEDAGCIPGVYRGAVGVYAGAGLGTYLLHLHANRQALAGVDPFQVFIGNDKDFLATRVSYKLNLEGPSLAVQTACSTSLVAVHLACQGLLSGECDAAIAGGVAVRWPQEMGALYREGGIVSPDGRCRAFDAAARGTVGGNGVGAVVLKRLEDALAEGDPIRAVIKGSAINNDGAAKVSYTAPRIDGQQQVIRAALRMAEVEAETITYVEAHGTGTPLGDPIEIAALAEAFGAAHRDRRCSCALGSVKTNIGHLDAAAGIAGLIKTVLALQHRQIPPSLHFEQPNPQIDFAGNCFYVNTALAPWLSDGLPRRAGVSSFGIGGTNAHVILEEAPAPVPGDPPTWDHQLLVVSAKTPSALEAATAGLAEYVERHPDVPLADVAHTLRVGRKAFAWRRMLVCEHREALLQALNDPEQRPAPTHLREGGERPVAFLLPGQGVQYVDMGRTLYRTQPLFRQQVDRCATLLVPHLGLDLRTVLYPDPPGAERPDLEQTWLAQPALFVVEYALAQLWIAWGVRPQALIGHSIGEYVAACLAGVWSLADALALVAVRGRLMQQLPPGAMLAVSLSPEALAELMGDGLALAAVNAPDLCTVSGSLAAVAQLQQQLQDNGTACRRLKTSHAFHSQMMDPILAMFASQVRRIPMHPPEIPFISNLTGRWIDAAEATDPDYWARHLRQPVLLAAGLAELCRRPEGLLLEVGPGRTLCSLAARIASDWPALPSLPHTQQPQAEEVSMLSALGRLWLHGARVDWSGFIADEQRQRLALPTYPFERQRYRIEPSAAAPARPAAVHIAKRPTIDGWFYLPAWRRTALPNRSQPASERRCWLLALDEAGVGAQLAERLLQQGQEVITVAAGTRFAQLGGGAFTLDPRRPEHYDALLMQLRAAGHTPQALVHLWMLAPQASTWQQAQDLGFYSLLHLAKALSRQQITSALSLAVVTTGACDVTGNEPLAPEQATILGPCKVLPQEYLNLTCRHIDVVLPEAASRPARTLVDQLLAELAAPPPGASVAYRGPHRWVQDYEPMPAIADNPVRLRRGGVYWITGGLGGIGLILADYLARQAQARLVLTGRTGLPERESWERWLADHGEHDATSRKIRQVQNLEQAGAEVLVLQADVADTGQMQKVLEQIDAQYGALHGVVHAAGILAEGAFRAVQEIDIAECERHFRAKVHGLCVLDELLRGRELDFRVLLSSLASVLGGLGYVAYTAANCFMDAFAHRSCRTDALPWLSVNWDAWQLGRPASTALGATLGQLALSPGEGVQAFERLLNSTVAQVVVSTGDLQARIDQWLRPTGLQPATAIPQQLHPRPTLTNPFVEPRNDLERTICVLWQQLLGVERIGVLDDFFELGGHSLLATQLLSRLRADFQVELPLRELFEAPTVTRLAELIAQHPGGGRPMDVAAIPKANRRPEGQDVAQLAQLSEDQIDTLLHTMLAES